MNRRKHFVLYALFLAASGFAEGDTTEFRNEIGMDLGRGNPCGYLCLEYTRTLSQRHGLGVGGGASFDGFNLSLGYKYFFQQTTRFNPYLGLSGFYATGLPYLIVTDLSSRRSAAYETLPGFAIAPRIGFRYQAGWHLNLYVNAGYAFVVQGGGVKIKDGSGLDSLLHSAAEVYALGGPEISTSVFYRF